jgi:hypothetical protein
MTQKPPALFVPNVYALGHLGHVVYVDPNDPIAHPSRYLPRGKFPRIWS